MKRRIDLNQDEIIALHTSMVIASHYVGVKDKKKIQPLKDKFYDLCYGAQK